VCLSWGRVVPATQFFTTLMQRIVAFCLLSWLLPAERFARADARPLHHLRGLDMPGKQPAGGSHSCQSGSFVPAQAHKPPLSAASAPDSCS